MAYLPHKRTLSPGSSSLLLKQKPARSPEQSWLKRRLKSRTRSDRTFFTLAHNRRNQPSRLARRLKAQRQRPQNRLRQRLVVLTAVCATLGGATWTNLFLKDQVTLAGVPYSIVDKFWSDKSARDAYFVGDKQALHDRLKSLGIEADIKDYYRDQFDSEYKLDKHIHQIMFDRTGYVGEAYRVNSFGELISISY